MQRYLLAACVVLQLVASAPAAAHGGEVHAKKMKAAPKEQTGWGVAGDDDAVSKTIEIRMSDRMRFTPERLTVRIGETIRLVVHNDGKLMHEVVIGSRDVLDKHAALMRKYPEMEHDEPYMAHVAPGERGEIVWKFNRAGEFDFGCLIAGHYESGMVGKIRVAAD